MILPGDKGYSCPDFYSFFSQSLSLLQPYKSNPHSKTYEISRREEEVWHLETRLLAVRVRVFFSNSLCLQRFQHSQW